MPQCGLRAERSRPEVGGEPSAHRQRQTSAHDSRSGKSAGRSLQLNRVVAVAPYRSCTWPGASMGTEHLFKIAEYELGATYGPHSAREFYCSCSQAGYGPITSILRLIERPLSKGNRTTLRNREDSRT